MQIVNIAANLWPNKNFCIGLEAEIYESFDFSFHILYDRKFVSGKFWFNFPCIMRGKLKLSVILNEDSFVHLGKFKIIL